MEKSIVIIGTGIAGLSAGVYGQMTGYRTTIFEKQDRPGGVCTSWQRDGYTVDGCLEKLLGSAPGTGLYGIWEELGVVRDMRVVNHDELGRVEGEGGETLIIYSDINRLEQHMKQIAPEDIDVIEKFAKGVRTCMRYEPPVEKAPELMTFIDKLANMLRMLPLFGLSKWKKVSIQDFAADFRSPFVREAFRTLGDHPDAPMITLMMDLAWQHRKVAGYPVGGSQGFARAIERRYLDLGGRVQYGAPVSTIIVENDQAIGVQLADGSQHLGNTVISAADGRSTIFDMLDGKYVNETIEGYYEKLPVFPPLIQVALGVARSFKGLPHSTNCYLDKPLAIAGKEHRRLNLKVYNFDQSFAPPGKTVLKVTVPTEYEYWKELRENRKRYDEEKEHIADRVVAILDRRFPGLKGEVEMRDVATPITWERYTGNWRGSYEGWLPTTKTYDLRKVRTLPDLKNFYMAGQWVEPTGGVANAALSGRNAIQIICKRDRRPFATTIA